jgi:hypothetical protein
VDGANDRADGANVTNGTEFTCNEPADERGGRQRVGRYGGRAR